MSRELHISTPFCIPAFPSLTISADKLFLDVVGFFNNVKVKQVIIINNNYYYRYRYYCIVIITVVAISFELEPM